MKLIEDKEELKQKFLEVVNYLFERGEMVKAFRVICDAPSLIEEEKEVLELQTKIQERLKDLSDMQNKGHVKGKLNKGFEDPKNVVGMVKFQLLKSEVARLGLKKLVDVGCYTGWLGRNLSLEGVEVHGIDIHPIILFYAGIASTGSLATFEFLPVEKLGFSHPLQYDGAAVFDTLEHVFDPEITIKSIEDSVKEGGWLFYNIPHPEEEHNSPRFENAEEREHLNSFSKKRLEELFNGKKNYKIEVITNEEGSINWFISYQK